MCIGHFARGDIVIWRSRPDGAVGYTLPAYVLQDDDGAIVLFQPAGTICKKRTGRRGGPRGRNLVDWSGGHEDVVFKGPGVIRFHAPGSRYAVLRNWEEGKARRWYVNLEEPWVRTPLGFDSLDLVVDIEVSPDLSSWSWKDTDELEWSVTERKLSREQATRALAEGRKVIEAIERRAWPFDGDWHEWTPDPSWPIPALPDGWAEA